MRPGLGTLAVAAAAVFVVALAPMDGRAAPASRTPVCDYCRMLIETPAYGGTIVLAGGKRYRFDAIECMAAAVLTDSVPPRTIRTMTAAELALPHAPLDVRRAHFLRSPGLHSPMGLNFSAHGTGARARVAQRRHRGELLDWKQVLASVDSIWFRGRLDVERHAELPAAK